MDKNFFLAASFKELPEQTIRSTQTLAQVLGQMPFLLQPSHLIQAWDWRVGSIGCGNPSMVGFHHISSNLQTNNLEQGWAIIFPQGPNEKENIVEGQKLKSTLVINFIFYVEISKWHCLQKLVRVSVMVR